MVWAIFKYIRQQLFLSMLALYFIGSALLKALTQIDICIPCIWKSIFGVNCPGCGLTTAFIALMKFDVTRAYHSNALIFIILPFLGYFLLTDFMKFYQSSKSNP